MHLSLTRLLLLLAPSSALLQVHTRLAKAILHKAKVDAMQQREALLAQAELLFAAAADIDDALAKLERGEAMAEPPVVTRLAPLLPDFYVGDPGTLETYIDGARKMKGMVGAFTSKFGFK